MTTILSKRKICAICGKTSTQLELNSTYYGDNPDLDSRPDELARSTMKAWIQTCPKCGYCAPTISQSIEKASEVIPSGTYQQQLHNPGFPVLANAFLCCSLLEENAGNYAGAGWASLHAAWVCDDVSSLSNAKKCRRKAVLLWRKAREFGQEFAQEVGFEEAIMADVLRRSGQFGSAIIYCDAGLGNSETEKKNLNYLSYQKELIGQRDVKCHTIAEMPQVEDEKKPKWIFECLELVAQVEHRSKSATKRLLIQEGILRYILLKLVSDPSIVIEQIAHLERQPESKTESLLIKKGLERYLQLFKEAVKNEPPTRRRISKQESIRLIGELGNLVRSSDRLV